MFRYFERSVVPSTEDLHSSALIQVLLSTPNPDDPLANDVAEQWKTNEAQAIETGI